MSQDFIERPHKNEKEGAIAYVQELLKQAREDRRNDDVEKLENLIRLLNTKKYGLVWEEHAELVEEEMKTKIPVFIEDETKKIVGNPESEDYNFLLEGDNLHSLHLLKKTHAGMIDVIYIDPPYNTGKKDFIYNDKIIDKTDGYSHSKWLSFMSNRLGIARELLSEKGVIFISIDDNEQAQLKLLCDEIFGETDFVCNFLRKTKSMTGDDGNGLNIQHEYLVAYAKNKHKVRFNGEKKKFDNYSNPDNDPNGIWCSADPSAKSGGKSTYFPIKNPFTGKEDYPPKGRYWAFSETTLKKYIETGKIKFKEVYKKNQRGFIFKRYAKQVASQTLPVDTLTFIDNAYMNSSATTELKNIFDVVNFSYPKPINFIKQIIKNISSDASIILDFFAGSGTTGHAVAQLNKEDGGNRKYILCTNNENNICEEVTYKRLTNIQEELPHNLKYFKTDFVVKEEFPDVTLEYELLNYVTPLVELEFGVDISNPKVQVILSEEQLDNMKESDFIDNSTLFIHPEVFFDSKQERILREKNITKQEIPDYYFGKDIWS
ncbi:site-specific DNA-methyltransferase [Streptococcus mutans]|uniref:site-specific DNA-methyltransferase n=1 Tax=Streptococcus mutans TaxID=1309 RepID=UPI0002B585BC|nr:site-specific DNA-methyltransferase [Streptococcus mutans]EMC23176.1 Site-specific DNA-methyltransferase (adenine- specific) [Streptococcus mutans SF14]